MFTLCHFVLRAVYVHFVLRAVYIHFVLRAVYVHFVLRAVYGALCVECCIMYAVSHNSLKFLLLNAVIFGGNFQIFHSCFVFRFGKDLLKKRLRLSLKKPKGRPILQR